MPWDSEAEKSRPQQWSGYAVEVNQRILSWRNATLRQLHIDTKSGFYLHQNQLIPRWSKSVCYLDVSCNISVVEVSLQSSFDLF